jgi:hypothetical protein
MSTSRLALLLWLEVLYPIVNHAVVQAQGLLAQYAPGIQETATAVGRLDPPNCNGGTRTGYFRPPSVNTHSRTRGRAGGCGSKVCTRGRWGGN